MRTRRLLSALSCRDARWLGLVVALAACSSGATPGAPNDAATGTDRAALADTPTSDTPATTDAPGLDAPAVDAPPLDAPTADATGDVAAADVDDPIESLRVDPAMTTLRVTAPTAPQTVQLRAQGITRAGRAVDVTPLWTVDRPAALTVSAAGLGTTANTEGGDVVVTARFGSFAARAAVRVVFAYTVVAPGAPADAPAAFPETATPGTDAARAPAWVYPANETVFPQNVYKVLFQWRRGTGNDRFRLTFESDRTRVSVVTDGAHPTCTMAGTGLGCFEPTLDLWRAIAAANPRGSVRVTLDAASSTAPGTFARASTLSIGFSRGPVPGAIFYWSTTVQGVRRATVGDAAPTNFLTPAEADRQCVACHTLSRRGNRLAADVGGHNLWLVEASRTTPPPRLVTALAGRDIPAFWSTISTDESRVITANRGVMTLRRATDGSVVNTLALPARTFGTQPDWAPDDSRVVFVQSASDRDRGVSQGQIATLEIRPGDMWGTARVLYGSGSTRPTNTNQYPSFSWDSQWIAWTRSTGNGQNDPTSDLWLMRSDGTAPRALTRANTVINNGVVTTATVQDNMPTWAPAGVPDDYAWIAFSSTRDYGGVLSGASRLGRHEQLWVAAVDLRTPGDADPSHPAFRLPFQGLAEDNHRPFWALDRVGTTCHAAGDACSDTAECCAPSVCRAGLCAAACAAADAPCMGNADCCAPGVCVSGRCRTACRPAGAACTSSSDCCDPGACVNGACAATTACHPTGGMCTRDTDCCSPGACREGACRPACTASGAMCTTSADCCAPNTCTAGVCRPPCAAVGGTCASDTDCCSPGACRNGVCGAACRAEGTDCTAGADCCSGVCTRGTCAPPPCRATGGSCGRDADCCSGFCVGGGCAPG